MIKKEVLLILIDNKINELYLSYKDKDLPSWLIFQKAATMKEFDNFKKEIENMI